jgi:hypothetical protein
VYAAGSRTRRDRGVAAPRPRIAEVIRRPCVRLVLTCAILLSGAVAVTPLASPVEDVTLAYEVRAAALKIIASLVTWPPHPHKDDSDLVICVPDDDPVGAALGLMIKSKLADGTPFRLRVLVSAGDVATCHVVYLGSGTTRLQRASLEAAAGLAILTVADVEPSQPWSGIVRFRTENHKLRLEIRAKAAERAGITISPKLLGMARIVE